MITLDLFHLFKTDPNSTKIPRLVSDWVIERGKQFSSIEFMVNFWPYKSEEEKELGLKFERIYGPSIPNFRNVIFPLNDGRWTVRLIGDRLTALKASGLIELLKKEDPRIQLIPSESEGATPRGYSRISPIATEDEEMVAIRCDRNTNDEWQFRGNPQEFLDEKVKPLLN